MRENKFPYNSWMKTKNPDDEESFLAVHRFQIDIVGFEDQSARNDGRLISFLNLGIVRASTVTYDNDGTKVASGQADFVWLSISEQEALDLCTALQYALTNGTFKSPESEK